MTALLDPRMAEKLARICGMFGSAHDGERAAAARKADQLVRAHGLTWNDVVCANKYSARADYSSFRDQVRFCFANIDLLNQWEHGFLLGIRKRRSLSDKQQRILNEIWNKVRDAGGRL